MDELTIINLGLGLVTSVLQDAPAILAAARGLSSGGTLDPAQQAALDAQIEAADAARLTSWAQADAALDAAAAK